MKRLIRWSVLALVALCCAATPPNTRAQDVEFIYVYDTDPQYVVEWMELLYRLVQSEGVNAPAASRVYGYAGVTLYESLVNGIPGNNSLAGQIWHMPDMPLPTEGVVYDWIVVHATAFSTVIEALLGEPSQEALSAIDDLRQAQYDEREDEFGKPILDDSIAYGEEIAAALLGWIAEDGYAEAHGAEYTLPTGEGIWELTTEGTRPAEPYWGDLRPLSLENVYDCHQYPTMYYSTDPESAFYAQAVEVMQVERHLSDEQAAIARYWVDTPGITGTPAGHWVSIANQLVEQRQMTLDEAAMLYAMLGPALMDSFISAWQLKYQTMVVRPVTYIRDNIRRSWSPYIESPPFPEYPSGHSVVSAAAAEVLTEMYGTVAFHDATHVIYGHEPLERSFTSFEAAASEAAISRLYGGIHFRHAIENGMRQGQCIGQNVMRYIQLRPLSQGGN